MLHWKNIFMYKTLFKGVKCGAGLKGYCTAKSIILTVFPSRKIRQQNYTVTFWDNRGQVSIEGGSLKNYYGVEYIYYVGNIPKRKV